MFPVGGCWEEPPGRFAGRPARVGVLIEECGQGPAAWCCSLVIAGQPFGFYASRRKGRTGPDNENSFRYLGFRQNPLLKFQTQPGSIIHFCKA